MNEDQKKIVKLLGLFVLCLFLSIIFFGVTGCANTAMVEDAKRETAYRKSLENYGKDQKPVEPKGKIIEREVLVCDEIYSTIEKETYKEVYNVTLTDKCHVEVRQSVETTPIAMPKEWMDQWPSLRDPKDPTEQFENGIIGQ